MRQKGRRDQPAAGGAAQLLARARAGLRRLEPWEAAAALEQWAVLVDVRPAADRAREGEVPGALVVDRSVLEWRLDPAGPDRLPLAHPDLLVIVLDSDGVTSSLAAAALQDVGVHRATDVVGGYRAWRSAGLPTSGGGAVATEHELGPAAAAFASGVVVVSAADGDGRPIGVAVRSFMALPGDVPLAVVALPSTSRTLQPVLAHGRFGISVLSRAQGGVARRFASGLPLADRFDGVPWTPASNGAPLVDGSSATLACALEREVSAGEHVVVFGRVVEATSREEPGAPLLYHHGALVGPSDTQNASIGSAERTNRSHPR